MEQMSNLLAGLGGLAKTFDAHPTGAALVVALAVVVLVGLRIWRGGNGQPKYRLPPAARRKQWK